MHREPSIFWPTAWLIAFSALCYGLAVFCNHGPAGLRQITKLLTQILP